MADGSKIEWTDATWNPITGCSVVSSGCTNCYAMRLAGGRLKHHASRRGLTRDTRAGPVWTGEVRLNEGFLDLPLKWTRPRRVFVCAHGDLFHEAVPDAWIDMVFEVMVLAPHHTFQVLTKRAARMKDYLSAPQTVERIYDIVCDKAINERLPVVLVPPGIDPRQVPKGPKVALGAWPLPNVWLGVSAEDQARAEERIPHLLATPAAKRFVSAEPLLGPMDLYNGDPDPRLGGLQAKKTFIGEWWEPGDGKNSPPRRGVDWVIVGGESGPDARPMHPDWVRSLRDQCAAAQVPFFFKQWGEWAPGENADGPPGRTEQTADWFAGRWHFGKLTPRQSEETHRDDEPDLYRVGKKYTGRLLDGREHNAMPEVTHD